MDKYMMNKPKKRIRDFVPTFIFLFFIGIIFILFLILPKSDYSTQEKRVLSDFPTATVETVFNGDFGSEFETYLADQMPLRTFFVGLNSYANMLLGENGLNGVYQCSDGYLINTPVQDSDNLNKNIEYINEFAEDIDVPVYMTVVPSTGYIMKDVLPAVHYLYQDEVILNKVTTQLSSEIQYMDLSKVFSTIVSDRKTQIFYKTDHHWTAEGAYIAYQELCNKMGLTATSKNDFNIESYGGFLGTTYSKSALWLSQPDMIELWKNKNHTENQFEVEIIDGGVSEKSNSLFYTEHLEEDDKYPVYLDGNHSLVKIKNNASHTGQKLLVIKDSFAHSIVPFFADNYDEIIMVDMRYYKNEVSVLVEEEKIDSVLVLYGLDNIVNDENLRALM